MAQASRGDVVKAMLLMLLCGLGIGFLPSTAKIALIDGGSVSTVVLARSLVVLAVLAAIIKLTGGSLLIRRSLLGVSIGAGLATGLQNVSAVGAISEISISLMMLITFAHPFLVAGYYHLNGTTPLTPYRLALSLLAFAGLALVLAVDFSRLSSLGLLLSASSMLFSAVIVITIVSLSKQVGGLTTTFQLAVWTLLVAVVAVAATGRLQPPATAVGWFGIVGSGVAFVVAYVAFAGAAKLIGGTRVSIFSFVEPIFAILVAAAMFGERLTGLQWIGALMVALCLFLLEAPAALAPTTPASADRIP